MKRGQYISDELQSTFQKESGLVRHFSPDLQIRRYDNATVLPSRGFGEGSGLVLDEKGVFVQYSAFTQGSEKIYNFDKHDVSYVDEEVVFLGVFHYSWGHALIDNFRHSWIFFSDTFKEKFSNVKLVYITTDNQPIRKNIVRLFNLANIDIEKAEQLKSITRFRAVYVPDDCVVNGEYGTLWSIEYKNIIDTIKHNVSMLPVGVVPPQKVYFTRTQLPQSTRDIGEYRIENVFRKLGYAVIAPETLSTERQIQIVMHCTAFAATEGSVAHNSIFAKPNTPVVLILKQPFFNPYQWMVNDMAQLDYTYIEAQNSFRRRDVSYGPFLMVKSKYLCEFAQIPYHHIPNWLSIDYWAYRYKTIARIMRKMKMGVDWGRKVFFNVTYQI